MNVKPVLMAGTSFAHLFRASRPAPAAPQPPAVPPAADPAPPPTASIAAPVIAAEGGDSDWESRALKAEKRCEELESELSALKAEKGEDGDDDSDEDGGDDSDEVEASARAGTFANRARKARLRERARCAAVFAEPKSAANPGLAAELAFHTNLPRSQAVALLQKGAASVATPDLAARMLSAGEAPLPPAPAPEASAQTEAQALAARVLAAAAAARGA